MRILHSILTDDFFGSENHCAQLAAGQIAAGHSVRVLIRGRNPQAVARFAAVVGQANLVALPRWWPGFLHGWAARRVLVGFQPDVVHVHLGRAAAAVGKAARGLGIPAVGTLHLTYKAKDYAHLNGLICVAEFQKNQEADKLKTFTGPVAVVRNWVEPASSLDPRAVAELRRAWGIPLNSFVLGSVGRLNKQKGYDVLIPAFRQAFPLGTEPVALVLVGEGEDRAALEALAAGDARIKLVGYQPHVADWLEVFDAFISSSRYEGLALVGLEALQAGLPMLLTGVAGNAEMAELCGLPTLPPDEVAAWPAALQALVAAGRRRVNYDLTPFEKSRALANIFAFYASVIAAKTAQ